MCGICGGIWGCHPTERRLGRVGSPESTEGKLVVSMSKNAIVIQGLKKQYRLGQIGGGTLRSDLESWWARLRRREDPNSRLDADPDAPQRFWALKGIDLQVKQGEALGIIGGNGAGKSTLLKILSRVTAPTEGTVDIEGRVASMLEVGTGFHGEMTGRENVYLNGAILGMTKAEIDAKMEDIIAFSEVGEFIDTPVKRYSSGMYVKLAFAVAAHLDAEIMIMDEVLAVGDMAFQRKCLEKMRAAATVEGKTVLYVSHNMSTIRRLCDRCIVLDKGCLVYEGAVEGAIEAYLKLGGVDAQTQKDLTGLPRPHPMLGKRGCMTHIRLEKSHGNLACGERVGITVGWKAMESLSHVRLRLILRSREDAPIGMAESAELPPLAAGACREDTVYLDTAMLADGTYYLSPVLYQAGEGMGAALDNVPRALTVQITGDEHWNSAWGNVKFPEMEVEAMQRYEI